MRCVCVCVCVCVWGGGGGGGGGGTYLSQLVCSTISIQRDTDPARVVVLLSKCYASTQGHLSCESHRQSCDQEDSIAHRVRPY